MNPSDDTRAVTVYGQHGRDVGKQFTVTEIDPLTLAGFSLRLNSAMRIDSYEALILDWQTGSVAGKPPIDLIMKALQGADPVAVHGLITELLDYVLVSPDPKHPGVNRALMKTDIREIKTLGEVLIALVKLNFGSE